MTLVKNFIPLIDSRKVISTEKSLFFAINGAQNNGHDYISDLYEQGVRNFVIDDPIFKVNHYPDANFKVVSDSTAELQYFAKAHREKFNFPIIAITGSNGKTIVKEWLSKLLEMEYSVVKSPRSYNSQVGVPLSIMEMKPFHNIGVFEAGISTSGEMEKLQKIIQPNIGVLTNIGSAHDEGFESKEHKIKEKLILFKSVDILIYRNEDAVANEIIVKHNLKTLSWSLNDTVSDINFLFRNRTIIVSSNKFGIQNLSLNIQQNDTASVENICHCMATLIYLNFPQSKIQNQLDSLSAISMRMELKKGANNCYLIDDAYNNDLVGLQTALDLFEQNNQLTDRTVILSDIYQSGVSDDVLYAKVNDFLVASNVNQLIGVGENIKAHKNVFSTKCKFYATTEDFLVANENFKNQIILIKGSRNFNFEKITHSLAEKQHRAYLDINLNALVNNLNFYKSKLNESTKLMAMVKAFAYGSGSNEIANILQYNRVDYLAVAYTDEGVSLRNNGIQLPIMVMNPDQMDFNNLIQYNLEPEIYSHRLLDAWCNFIQNKPNIPKIHIKVDTGMHRLGFGEKEVDSLIQKIIKNSIKISSIFSHLATADDSNENEFTKNQISKFNEISGKIEKEIRQQTLKHILNSSGIVAHPEAQMDMVRLGIGMYGFDPTLENKLDTVISLYAQISQIKHVKSGESIGYGRAGYALKDMNIATINIGYADGISRRFSNGNGAIIINGQKAKIIGNVCMDMLMADIRHIKCSEGDKVEIFGKQQSVLDFSNNIDTVPYEILTSISERVKRVYFKE